MLLAFFIELICDTIAVSRVIFFCVTKMSDLESISNEEIDVFEDATSSAFESMLITTDSFEEFTQELSVSLENDSKPIQDQQQSVIASSTDEMKTSISEFGSQDQLERSDSPSSDDYLHDAEWLNQREHIFILSTAGKPIYSFHGNEDKLATIFGVMQALVSVVHANQDVIMSIHAVGMKFVFLQKGPLILVAASRRNISVQQIQLQLT